MNLETKLQLLKLTDNYWIILPEEIKELILKYRESQELIERHESASKRALCKQIRMYGELGQKWQVGHIQCRPMRFEGSHTLIKEGHCSFGEKCEHMQIYGYYFDVRGVISKCFLGFSLRSAMEDCHY